MSIENPKDAIGSRKASMSCVPLVVMAEVGLAMLEGGCKHGRFNYRAAGIRSSVYYDALWRHIGAWWDEGQDIDPGSGLHHVTKAIATLVVLRDAMIQGMVADDRPPSSKPFIEKLNAKAADIVDCYAECSPKHYTIADTISQAESVIDRPTVSAQEGRHL